MNYFVLSMALLTGALSMMVGLLIARQIFLAERIVSAITGGILSGIIAFAVAGGWVKIYEAEALLRIESGQLVVYPVYDSTGVFVKNEIKEVDYDTKKKEENIREDIKNNVPLYCQKGDLGERLGPPERVACEDRLPEDISSQ